jgi:hypothetical protein
MPPFLFSGCSAGSPWNRMIVLFFVDIMISVHEKGGFQRKNINK